MAPHLKTYRRWCIANKCGGDVSIWNRYYPTTLRDCFAVSEKKFFSEDVKEHYRNMIRKPKVTGDMSIEVDSGGTTTVFPPLQRWRMNVSTATPPDGYDVRISGEIRCESTFAGSEGDTFASWIFDAGFLLLGPIDEPTSITPASTTARPGMTMAAREARQPTGWLAFSSGVGEMTVSRFDPQGVFAASGWAAADPELGQPGEIRIDLDFEFTPPSP